MEVHGLTLKLEQRFALHILEFYDGSTSDNSIVPPYATHYSPLRPLILKLLLETLK
jgi:hypothetical protein